MQARSLLQHRVQVKATGGRAAIESRELAAWLETPERNRGLACNRKTHK